MSDRLDRGRHAATVTRSEREIIIVVSEQGRANLGRIGRAGVPLARNYRVVHEGGGVLTFHPLELNPEIWVPMVEWEDDYEVSDQGRARDAVSGKMLMARIEKNNYFVPMMRLRVANRPDLVGYGDPPYVHRSLAKLVLGSFGDPCPGPGYQAEHLDGDATNCALVNLQWRLSEETLR
jgi:hypothetical protein